MTFVHLHTRSHYTLLESPTRVGDLVAAATKAGMPALALTDRGNLFGALEFQKACAKAKLKGIIGCEAVIAPLGMAEKTIDTLNLVLLATSSAGYANLARLVSAGWLEGFYYEPRVDLARIANHAGDLICLTGAGPDGALNRHLTVGAVEEATRQAALLRDIFADRLYVELVDHGDPASQALRQANTALAKGLGLPVVASNWVHYLHQQDAAIHDVQLAVQKATSLADPRRKRMPGPTYHFRAAGDMAALFADQPDALANTLAIAERCAANVIPTGTYHLPAFTCPDGLDQDAYLRQLCEAGLSRRYADITTAMRERLDFELATIQRMGFPGYFLIVQDFIGWAKNRGIPVGPGRGSAAGSLVAYSLGITDICPLRYHLLFERFLNPGRITMPDIDIDFCKDRRGEVIDYVAGKYGREAVTQIMTLGTMKARSAIKDVARAYDWTPEESQELANLVPEDPTGEHGIAVCLGKKKLKSGEEAVEDVMAGRYAADERTRRVLDTAMVLEGSGRNLGVHACGIIIAPGPVSDYVPVCAVKGKPATQFNMSQVEDCGLLKMDFLGLKTMSVLKKAADIVAATGGPVIDYPTLPLDDAATFKLLGEGDTLGVFQCESSGFQELIRRLKPDRFEDMIALVALYRPGPLQAGMHTSYCDRKHGLEPVDYPHPVLHSILQETYGLYIYQEQVMNISRELCGFSPAEADNLRKAMGKKQLDVLEKMKEKFITGAWERHQFPKDRCQAMWDNILGFASYGFNKSHSACYGLIAYWTAYMKANHYAAFMTANLVYEMHNKDKMTQFIQEMRGKGVPVLPPDLNESGWEFTWTGENVRFGFGGVKGVGEGSANHLIALREGGRKPFTSLFDLCERVETRSVNKRVLEALIRVGALDSLHPNRRALMETAERAMERGTRVARGRAQAQTSLFATFEQDAEFREQSQGYPDVPDWEQRERLAHEKELTGYWMSSHPLVQPMESLRTHASHRAKDLAERPSGLLAIAAVVIDKREIKTRAGKRMAVLALEDLTGRFEAVLFGGRANRRGQEEPGAYERFAELCQADLVGLFIGKIDERRRQRRPAPRAAGGDDEGEPVVAVEEAEEDASDELPSLLVEDVVPVDQLAERLTREIVVSIDAGRDDSARLARTESLLKEHPGACPLRMLVATPAQVLLTVRLGERWRAHPTPQLLAGLRGIWGAERVEQVMTELAGGATKR